MLAGRLFEVILKSSWGNNSNIALLVTGGKLTLKTIFCPQEIIYNIFWLVMCVV